MERQPKQNLPKAGLLYGVEKKKTRSSGSVRTIAGFRLMRVALLLALLCMGNSVFASPFTNWYLLTSGTGDISVMSNWTRDATGGTVSGTLTTFSPASGTSYSFNIQNFSSPTLGTNLTIGGGGGTVTITVGDGSNAVNFTIPSGVTLTNTGAAINVSANATLTITSINVPSLGTLNAASTVVYNAASSQTITSATYGNLTFGDGNNAISYPAAGALTVNGTLTGNKRATLNMGTYQLLGTLAAINNKGVIETQATMAVPIPDGIDWSSGGRGIVWYDNTTTPQSVSTGTYDSLTVGGGSGTVTHVADGDLTVNKAFETWPGTTLNMGTHRLLGTVTNTFNNGTFETQYTGSDPYPQSMAWSNSSGTVLFDGAAAQTMPGGSYTNITINNSAGATASDDIVFVGTLNFINGIINTNGTNFELNGTWSGAGPGNYIEGTVMASVPFFSTNPVLNLPVGDATGYVPIQLFMTGTSFGGLLRVTANSGLHPQVASSGLNSSAMVNHYWTISTLGPLDGITSVIPQMAYSAGDILGGGDNSSFVAQVYNGSSWLGSPVATTPQTSLSPVLDTSTFNTGISGSSVAGDYILGNAAAAAIWYSNSTDNLDNLTAWGANTDGSGANPTDFTTPGQTWNIVNNTNPTIGAAWSPVGTVNVGNGGAHVKFTIPSNFAYGGDPINLLGNSGLTITNVTVPALGSIDASSTVVYNASAAQTIAATAYGSLFLSNTGGAVTDIAAGPLSASQKLVILPNVTLNMGTNQLTGVPGFLLDVDIAGVLETQATGAAPIPAGINWTQLGGTIIYDNTTAPQVISTGTYSNLTVGGASGALAYTTNGDITVIGQLETTLATTTLSLGTNNLIGGYYGIDVLNNGTIETQATDGNHIFGSISYTGTVLYDNPTAPQVITSATYNNLVLGAGSGTNSYTTNGDITVNGTLGVTYGTTVTLDMGTNQLLGTLTADMNAATVKTQNTGSTPIPAGVDWATPSNNLMIYNGASAQTIVTGTYQALQLDNTAGGTMNGDISTVGLILSNGILNTASHSITTGGNSIFGANSSNYVNGTLQELVNAPGPPGQPLVFPVGDDLGYEPMQFTSSGTLFSGTIGVKVTSGLHPNVASSQISSTQIVNHYWTVTSSGLSGFGSVTPQVTYDNAGDILGGDNSSFVMQVYTGSWLGAPLATTNTQSPDYTSAPATGLDMTSLAGDYVFGNVMSQSVWYSNSSGNLDDLATWGSNTDGSGTNPTDFTSAGQTWNIVNNTAPSIVAAWNPAGTVNVGDGGTGINFPIPSGFAYGGDAINVLANSTLTITNTTVPSLGTLNAASTVVYNAASSQNIVSTTYGSLTVGDGSSTVSYAASGDLIVNNNLTINNSATLHMGVYQLSGSDNISNHGTIETQNTGSTPLPDNLSLGLSPISNTVVYDGVSAQTIIEGTYKTLVINNPAGALINGDVWMIDLVLTNGIINTNSHGFYMTDTAFGGGAGSYVKGTLTWNPNPFVSNPTIYFPVGDDGGYAPMYLSTTGMTCYFCSGDIIGITAHSGLHPQAGTSGLITGAMVNHYWTISEPFGTAVGLTVIPQVSYSPGDILGGGNNSSFVAQVYNGSSWLGSPITTTPQSSVSPALDSSTFNSGIASESLVGDYILGGVAPPASITGNTTVCQGAITSLTDNTTGGTWSSQNGTVAGVDANGNVTGITGGTAVISYVTATGSATTTVTVNPLPTPIIGQGVFSMITTVVGDTGQVYSHDGVPATATSLSQPAHVAVDAAGNIYIVTRDFRVRKVSTDGIIHAFAGNGTYAYNGDDGPATAAAVAAYGGVAVDAAGNVYIGDTYNQRVRKVDPSGIITTVAGNGSQSYSGDGVAATATSVAFPGGVAVDASGNLYIADGNNRIRKVDPSGMISTVAGNGSYSYNGDGIAATNASFSPTDVAVDAAGNIYIADGYNGRIRKVDASGIITTVTGNGTQTYGGYGDGGPATAARLADGYGVAVDAGGNIYIADQFDNRLRKINTSGIITTIAGNGIGGGGGDGGAATAASLYNPSGVAVDAAGNVYIADMYNSHIRKINGGDSVAVGSTIALSDPSNGGSWSASNSNITVNAGTGVVTGVAVGIATVTYTLPNSCNGATLSVKVYGAVAPNPIAGNTTVCQGTTTALSDIDASGVWSTPNTTVAAVDASGNVTGLTGGTAVISYTTAGGSATTTVTVNPLPAAITGPAITGIISTIAGNGDFVYSGDGIAATAAALVSPDGVAVDAAGNVYIADNGSASIRKVNTSGIISTVAGNGSSSYNGDGIAATSASITAKNIAIDAAGNIYISDVVNNRIRKINTLGIISTVAGNAGSGYGSDGVAATSTTLNSPTGVAVDAVGNIYIADGGNNRIRKVSTLGIISTVAGNGSGGYSSDGVAATATKLNNPYGVAVDVAGNIYIADENNNRIRKVNTSGIISTVAGNGSGRYGSDGVAATSTSINNPQDVIVDAAGNIYIADFGNDRVRKVNTSGIISTVTGPGNASSGFGGDGGAATAGSLNAPNAIAVDAIGNMYVSDFYNGRVRKISYSDSVAAGRTIALSDPSNGGSWSASNGNITVDAGTGLVTGVTAGVATVTYTLPNGCNGAMLSVTVYGALAPNPITGNTTVCQGSITSLTDNISGGTWSTTNTTTAIVNGSGRVTGVTAGAAVISYTTLGGTVTTTVTVNGSPSVISIGNTGPACTGASLGLTSSATGGIPPLSYSWAGPNSYTGTGANPSVSASVSLAAAGTYTLSVTDGNSCKAPGMNTTTAAVTVCNVPPVFVSSSPQTFSMCKNGVPYNLNSLLHVSDADASQTETWTQASGGAPTHGTLAFTAATASSGSTNITPGGSITYTPANGYTGSDGFIIQVSDGAASASITVSVTVNALPSINSIGSNGPVCSGNTLTLNSSATGTATLGYSWTGPNSFTGTGTGPAVSASATTAATGIYTLTVTDGNTCVNTATTSATVLALPDITTGWSVPTASDICAGNPLTMTINSAGLVGGTTYRVRYNIDGATTAHGITTDMTFGLSGTGTFNTLTLSSAGTTTITVTAIQNEATNCDSDPTSNNAVAVTVNPNPTVNAGTVLTAICRGGTTAALGGSLSGGATGGIWTSSDPAGTFNNNGGTTPGAATYIASLSSAASVTLTLTTTGGSCGSASATKTLTVNTLPVINTIGSTGIICANNALSLNSSATGTATLVYSWAGPNTYSGAGQNPSVSASATTAATGVYTLTVTDGHSCVSTATTSATVNALPVINTIGNNGPVCSGFSLSLNSSTTGTPTLNYSWAGPSFSTTGANPTVSASATTVATGIYTLTVTDGNTCVTTNTTSATVYALPVINSISSGPVCTNTPLNLSSSATGAATLIYSWTGPVDFNTTGQNVNVTSSATPTVSGIYTLTVTDGHTCVTSATTNAVVNPLPNIDAINNNSPVCEGAVLNLTSSASDGTGALTYHWSGPAGYNVFGQNPSITNVPVTASGSYVLTVTDINNCVATGTNTTVAAVIPVAQITGITEIQDLSLTTLSDATPGGVWSSPQSVISIAPGTGGTEVVTGLSAGVDVVSYTHLGCTRTAVIDVYPTALCVGTNLQLSDDVAGGTWSSGNMSFATVNLTTGVATGVSAGTVSIYHNVSGHPQRIYSLSVGGLQPSSGSSLVCQGQTLSLTNSVTPGTWSSNNTSLATVSGGVVGGISPGAVDIVYLAANGCLSVKQVVVNARAAITGPTTVCVGQAIQLNNINNGGTWSSSNVSMATVGLNTGVVTGASTSTINVFYTLPTGCLSTATVTVNPLVATSGLSSVCQNQAITLTNSTSGGGTWSSGNTLVATVSSTGGTNGVAAGSVAISFTTPLGCVTTKTITVNGQAQITGTAKVCAGQTTQLSVAITGGTWSSSNLALATVASTGIVSGVSAGTLNISYSPSGGCLTSTTVMVNPLLVTGGLTSICQSQPVTLTNTTPGGGTWSSSNTLMATVGNTTGTINGVAIGAAVISFTTPQGCVATKSVTINAGAPITGTVAVCAGQAAQLTDAIAGGTWSSSNNTMATITSAGVVSGVSAGAINISYSLAGGCVMTTSVSVNPLLAIGGPSSICQSPITLTNTTSGGGTWSTANTLVATVISTTGVTNGVSAGSAVISFSTPLGCIATKTITVNTGASITGGVAVCVGQTTQLSDAAPGGTWSSSNVSLATVTSTGLVSGVSASTPNILYTLPGGCVTTATVTVNPLAATGGLTSACQSQPLTLTNNTSGGGNWSSSNTLVATVGSTGVVNGVSGGPVVISFTTPKGCVATQTVTINALAPLGGTASVCQGQTIQLSEAVAGGTWLSYNVSMATVSNTGVVTGVSPTTIGVVYTVTGGCTNTTEVTINPLLASTGFLTVCQTQAITLANTTNGGGAWSTGSSLIATVNSATGSTNGVAAGVAIISFTTNKGCVTTKSVTVNPLLPIAGVTAICRHQALQLSDAVPGGTWSSSNNSMATVTPLTGIVTGVSASTISIVYTLPTGCVTSTLLTVDPCGKSPDTTETTSVIENTTGIGDIKLFPNPSKGTFNIKGSLNTRDDAEVSVEITDMLGQIVYRKAITAQAGNINEQVQLGNSIANSMYIVTVRSGAETKMFHIVVEK